MHDMRLPEDTWVCGQTLVALVLVLVGALSVRPVEQRAGHFLIGAGLLVVLKGFSDFVPQAAFAVGGLEAMNVVGAVLRWVGPFIYLGAGVATVVSAALLARAIAAPRSDGWRP